MNILQGDFPLKHPPQGVLTQEKVHDRSSWLSPWTLESKRREVGQTTTSGYRPGVSRQLSGPDPADIALPPFICRVHHPPCPWNLRIVERNGLIEFLAGHIEKTNHHGVRYLARISSRGTVFKFPASIGGQTLLCLFGPEPIHLRVRFIQATQNGIHQLQTRQRTQFAGLRLKGMRRAVQMGLPCQIVMPTGSTLRRPPAKP